MSKSLEAIFTASSLIRDQWMSTELAVREVLAFERNFGRKHLKLACHAALPLILTPELINLIHINFLDNQQIPWVAEIDFLLSPLCRPIDESLYEVEPSVREVLLVELENQFGWHRPFEISKFLLVYLYRKPDLKQREEIVRCQWWIAQAYLDPDHLIRELTNLLDDKSNESRLLNLQEQIQVIKMLEVLESPLEKTNLLTEYKYLVNNSRVLTQLLYGDEKELRPHEIEKEYLTLLSPTVLKLLEDLEETAESPEACQAVNVLDLPRFYNVTNPSKPLSMGTAVERQYYIDFSSVRGSKIIDPLKRTIALISPNEPTCQLFTGHIGCGKSTELLRLKAELEQQGFHVVYFESSQDLDMADVDITDILFSVIGHISESLESVKIRLKPSYFTNLFTEIVDFLQTPIELEAELELSIGIGKITAKTKESPKLRRRLREYLEPRINGILKSINQELLDPATAELKRRGNVGLVVIVDNLDRVDIRPLPSGRTQPEYLFIDRGEQLRRLNCHVVYTIPLSLIFCNTGETLRNRLGGGLNPIVLPMVPVRLRNGEEFQEGMALLRQMVMARAFPNETPEKRIALITEVFDSPETLNRLCRVSGGHVRLLLGMLFDCLRQEEPPLSRECLELVIRERRDYLTSSIDDQEWKLLFQVVQQQTVKGDAQYQILLRSMWVFEYCDRDGRWYSINPLLEETHIFQSWMHNSNHKS